MRGSAEVAVGRTKEATDNRHLLAYMHRMAQTAQSATAKRAFVLFAQAETRRIELHGG